MGQVERAGAKGRTAAGNVRLSARHAGNRGTLQKDPAGISFPSDKHSPDMRRADIPPDLAFLTQFGFSASTLSQVAAIARSKSIPASEVLLARGLISVRRYRALAARQTGADHSGSVPDFWVPARREAVAREQLPETPLLLEREGRKRIFVPLDGIRMGKLLAFAGKGNWLLRPFVLVPPAEMRIAHLKRNAAAYTRRAADLLHQAAPGHSAKRRTTPFQACFLAGAAFVLATMAILAPALAAVLVGLASTLFFVAALFLRVYLHAQIVGSQDSTSPWMEVEYPEPEDLPVYSILVPLYDEPGQVAALVRSLDRIDWPSSKKEIFVVCEADDTETIAAVRRTRLPDGFHLVTCPPSHPRTKPKALNYALPLAGGEFTVIYDAEDRPHPLQLREAYAKFRHSDERYACLQAPLAIRNGAASWLSGMFEMEYDVLFRGMLPALEKVGGPIPLGGTSNHFRTEALRASGGWDAWNVTEDADLGMRLARLGRRCGTITLPTLEEAPERTQVWVRQRTRWLKGWMQTILVHLRNPAQLYRELGCWNFLLFQLLLTSIVVSALVHPFVLAHMAIGLGSLFAGHALSPIQAIYLGVEVFSMVASYTTYAIFAVSLDRQVGKRIRTVRLLSLPAYWILISLSAWRATWQFLIDPFRWEKTDHSLANSSAIDNIETNLTAIAE